MNIISSQLFSHSFNDILCLTSKSMFKSHFSLSISDTLWKDKHVTITHMNKT